MSFVLGCSHFSKACVYRCSRKMQFKGGLLGMQDIKKRTDNGVYRDLIKEAEFDFDLPVELEEEVHELEKAIVEHPTIVDCLQDEIRSLARLFDDEDKEEQVIDFFCRRRWVK